MASPVVAGAAALLLGRANDLFNNGRLTKSPFDLVKDGDIQRLLTDTAFDRSDIPSTDEGAGNLRVDLAEALLVERFGRTPDTPDPCRNDSGEPVQPMSVLGARNMNGRRSRRKQ